eukprot:TRINITY_DN6377_c0_g1_i1.p1 TRINITY_DN6377_c0_g1~~TRINITY_DN6377_c0_g1_i1.p1  ORF type:complete len:1424 (+),score=58.25 TRINITY_DN6377_c0_g1_i1:120-4391(+)
MEHTTGRELALLWLFAMCDTGGAQPDTSTCTKMDKTFRLKGTVLDKPCTMVSAAVDVGDGDVLFGCSNPDNAMILCRGVQNAAGPADCATVSSRTCSGRDVQFRYWYKGIQYPFTTTNWPANLALHRGAGVLFVGCGDEVKRCKWDDVGKIATGCATVSPLPCDAFVFGLNLLDDSLVVLCQESDGMETSNSGLWFCPLTPAGDLAGPCEKRGDDPCRSVVQKTAVYGTGFMPVEAGGVLAMCSMDGVAYCSRFSTAAGASSCQAVSPHPCPTNDFQVTVFPPSVEQPTGPVGAAVLSSGQLMFLCQVNGAYVCGAPPTSAPSLPPTVVPSYSPNVLPTIPPLQRPTQSPSAHPWTPGSPSALPSAVPTGRPYVNPSAAPCRGPTELPWSSMPTTPPRRAPLVSPTFSPWSSAPSSSPRPAGSLGPTSSPHHAPSAAPKSSTMLTFLPTTSPAATPGALLAPSSSPRPAVLLGPNSSPYDAPSAAPNSSLMNTLLPTMSPAARPGPPQIAPTPVLLPSPTAAPATATAGVVHVIPAPLAVSAESMREAGQTGIVLFRLQLSAYPADGGGEGSPATPTSAAFAVSPGVLAAGPHSSSDTLRKSPVVIKSDMAPTQDTWGNRYQGLVAPVDAGSVVLRARTSDERQELRIILSGSGYRLRQPSVESFTVQLNPGAFADMGSYEAFCRSTQPPCAPLDVGSVRGEPLLELSPAVERAVVQGNTAATGAATAVAFVGGVLGTGSSAGGAARLGLVQSSFDCLSGEVEEFDITLSPLQLSFGEESDAARFAKGAVVGNLLIMSCALGGVIAGLALEHCRYVRRVSAAVAQGQPKPRRTLHGMLIQARCSWLVVPASLLCGGSYAGSVTILMNDSSSGCVALAVMCILFFGVATAVYAYYAARKAPSFAKVVRTDGADGQFVTYSLRWFVCGEYEWIPLPLSENPSAHELLALHHVVIEGYKDGLQRYAFAIELGVTFFLAVIAGLNPASVSGCMIQAAAFTSVSGLYALFIGCLRPYITPVENALNGAVALAEGCVSGMVVLAFLAEPRSFRRFLAGAVAAFASWVCAVAFLASLALFVQAQYSRFVEHKGGKASVCTFLRWFFLFQGELTHYCAHRCYSCCDLILSAAADRDLDEQERQATPPDGVELDVYQLAPEVAVAGAAQGEGVAPQGGQVLQGTQVAVPRDAKVPHGHPVGRGSSVPSRRGSSSGGFGFLDFLDVILSVGTAAGGLGALDVGGGAETALSLGQTAGDVGSALCSSDGGSRSSVLGQSARTDAILGTSFGAGSDRGNPLSATMPLPGSAQMAASHDRMRRWHRFLADSPQGSPARRRGRAATTLVDNQGSPTSPGDPERGATLSGDAEPPQGSPAERRRRRRGRKAQHHSSPLGQSSPPQRVRRPVGRGMSVGASPRRTRPAAEPRERAGTLV